MDAHLALWVVASSSSLLSLSSPSSFSSDFLVIFSTVLALSDGASSWSTISAIGTKFAQEHVIQGGAEGALEIILFDRILSIICVGELNVFNVLLDWNMCDDWLEMVSMGRLSK